MTTYHPEQIRNLAVQLETTANTLNHQFSTILQSIKLSTIAIPLSKNSSQTISNSSQSTQPHPTRRPHKNVPSHPHHDLNKYTELEDDEELFEEFDLCKLSQHIATNPALFDPQNNRPPQLSGDGRLIKLDESTEHRTHRLKKDIELLLTTIQNSLLQQNPLTADPSSKITHQPQHRDTLHDLLHMLSIMYTVDDTTYYKHYEPICQYFHDFLFHPNSTRLVPSKYPQSTDHSHTNISQSIPSSHQPINYPPQHQLSPPQQINNPLQFDPNSTQPQSSSSFFDLPIKVKHSRDITTLSPNPQTRTINRNDAVGSPQLDQHIITTKTSTDFQITPTNQTHHQPSSHIISTPTVTKNPKRHYFDDSTPTSQSQQLKHQSKSNKQSQTQQQPPHNPLGAHNQVVRSNRRTQLGDNDLEALFDQNPEKIEKNTRFGVINQRRQHQQKKHRQPSSTNKNDESTDATIHSKYDSDDGTKGDTTIITSSNPNNNNSTVQSGTNKSLNRKNQQNDINQDSSDHDSLEDFYSSQGSDVEAAFKQIERDNFPTPTAKQYEVDPKYKDRTVQRQIVQEKRNTKSGKKGYVTQFIPSLHNRDPHIVNDPDIVIEGNIALNQQYAADLDDLSSSSSPWDDQNKKTNNNCPLKSPRRGSIFQDNDFKLGHPPVSNPHLQTPQQTNNSTKQSPLLNPDGTPGRSHSNTFQTTPVVTSTSQHNVPNGIEFVNGRWTKVKTSNVVSTRQDDDSSGFESDDDEDENALDDIPDFDTPEYTSDPQPASAQNVSPFVNHNGRTTFSSISTSFASPSNHSFSSQTRLSQAPSTDRIQIHNTLGKLMQADPVTGQSYPERIQAVKHRAENRLKLCTMDQKTLKQLIEDEETNLSTLGEDDAQDLNNRRLRSSSQLSLNTNLGQQNGNKKTSPPPNNPSTLISPTPATITFKGASIIEHGDSDIPETPQFTSHGGFFAHSHYANAQENHHHLAELAGLQLDAIDERRIVSPTDLAGADVLDGLSTASSSGTSLSSNSHHRQPRGHSSGPSPYLHDKNIHKTENNSNTGNNVLPQQKAPNNLDDEDLLDFDDFDPSPKPTRPKITASLDGRLEQSIDLDDMSEDEDSQNTKNNLKRQPRTKSTTPSRNTKMTFIQGVPQENLGGIANFQGFTKQSSSSSSISSSSIVSSLNAQSLTNHHKDKESFANASKQTPSNSKSTTSHRPPRDKSKTRTISLDFDDLDGFGDSDEEKMGLELLRSAANPHKNTNATIVKEENHAKKELNELRLPPELQRALLMTEQYHNQFFGSPLPL